MEIFASLGVRFFHFCVLVNEPLKVVPSGVHTKLPVRVSSPNHLLARQRCIRQSLSSAYCSAGPAFSRRDLYKAPPVQPSRCASQHIFGKTSGSSKATYVPVRPNQGIHSRSLLSNMLYAASLFLEGYVLVPIRQKKGLLFPFGGARSVSKSHEWEHYGYTMVELFKC